MNKYQTIFQGGDTTVSEAEIISALDNISSWEDGYWLCKILMAGNGNVSDERLIDALEYCFFMGLTIANKEIFYDANECLAKLYIRYGMYSEASSKLQNLINNIECPDWVHLYFATTQLYTIFDRIVEEPKFFFERLLNADINNPESRAEMQSVFRKYMCLIVEKQPETENIACEEIVRFAEKILVTATDEFRVFHEAICPDLPYTIGSDESADIDAVQKELEKAKAAAARLQEEAARSQKAEEAAKQAAKAAQEKAAKSQEEAEKSKNAAEEARHDAEKAKYDANESKAAAERAKKEVQKLKDEKSALAARLEELEKTKQTALQPQSIDDVFSKMTSWLNVKLRRYLAQWLTIGLTKNGNKDFWNKKVKLSLSPKELAKFDSYKELTDFAIDALLKIYYNNLNDFHPYSSMAKTNDREHIQEMQQIRNRWVGHFEENSWTKEKILFDIDTIIEFINQIDMPREVQKEYIEFRALVAKMK